MLKLLEVNSRHHRIPTVNAGVTGTFKKATSTIGMSGVSIARPPATPVSCLELLCSATGALKANLMPFTA